MKLHTLLLPLLAIGLSAASQAQKSDGDSELASLNVFIPNAFTPNSDGLNDVFKPVVDGAEIEAYELSIIDRRGQRVFFSENPAEVWDGSGMGDSYLRTPDVFLYQLRIKSTASIETKLYQGHLTVLR